MDTIGQRCGHKGSMVVVGGTRVIVGVSGSLRSLGALRVGAAEACSTGATLLAVLAWAPEGGEYAYRRAPSPVLLKYWEHAAHERMREAFDAAFGGMPPAVRVQTMIVRAKPGPLLVGLADQHDDLLVVGCGGRRWPGRALHGAVARYCVAHARCPVLVVPPPDLISKLRPWRHLWRPEDLTDRPRRGGLPAASVENPASVATDDLPAYHGAPYYQPRPRSRKRRVLRRLRLGAIIGTGILLVILAGILLNHMP
jgi:nucleotide-binding universal stress UspA family protein